MSNSNDDVRVSIHGAVTRVQHGAEAAEEQDQHYGETSRAYSGGSLTTDPLTGQVQTREALRVNAADFQRPHGFGILATARTSFGSPARELTPDTVVAHGGMEMKLEQAEQLGLVKRDGSGRYSEIGAEERVERQRAVEHRAQARQQPQPEEGDVAAMREERFSPEVEAGLAKLVEGVPPQMVNQVLMDAALRIAETGSLDELNVEAVVSKTGMAPEQAAQFMEASLTALSAQADRALLEQHVDPAQFVEWARRERPEQFKQAMLQHVGVRSLLAYRALAKDFVRNTSPDAAGLRQAGFETMTDPNSKELLVKFNGMWMSARAAAIQGLI